MVAPSDAKVAPADKVSEKIAPKAPPKPADILRSCLDVVVRGVTSKDTRLLSGRLMRLVAAVRRQLTTSLLATFINDALATEEEGSLKATLLSALAQVHHLMPFVHTTVIA
jgi:hypothetical protein